MRFPQVARKFQVVFETFFVFQNRKILKQVIMWGSWGVFYREGGSHSRLFQKYQMKPFLLPADTTTTYIVPIFADITFLIFDTDDLDNDQISKKNLLIDGV